MANFTISPNMGLSVPSVGSDPSPDWANNLNASLSILDGHNHSAGSGVQITPNGLDINIDLAFQNNNATQLRSARFTSQMSPISGAQDLDCIYVSGVDLYYNDGNGNQIRITSGGSVNATSSGISSGTATAGFVAGTLVVDQAANTPGNIQAGSILIGDNVANSKFVTVSAPGSLASNYTITLPLLPAQQSFMTLDQFGNEAAPWTVDGTTIVISSNQLHVPSSISNNYVTNHWQLNGVYSGLSYPLTEVDGFCFFNYNATIIAMWIYNVTPGSGGTTEFDLKVASPGGSFTSILSTVGSISSAAAANAWTDSNSVVGAQTGVVKPIISNASISAGQAIRWDILTSQTGAPADCGVIIQFVGR